MNDLANMVVPEVYPALELKCEEYGFDQPSDLHIGSLLKSLVASKPNSNILELGTGIGLSLSWMIEGLDEHSRITSLDNDPKLIALAKEYFDDDPRVTILCQDGEEWIEQYSGDKFDLIFADTWPGKYNHLEETLDLLKVGGLYIIDDMNEEPNWPEGHAEKASQLIHTLETKAGLTVVKMDWSTGIIICTKQF